MSEVKMSAIDRALAAAKARKAAKEAAGITSDVPDVMPKAVVPKAPKTPKEPKVKMDNDDPAKAERNAAREVRRAEKAAREAADRAVKDARKADRAAAKLLKAETKVSRSDKPAHMKKVERARSKCPPMNVEMEKLFSEAVSNFSAQQIDALAQHLLVHNRAYKTQRASESTPFEIGATVTITGGEAKYIGMTGTVTKSQKLRTTLTVEGINKPLYVYTADAKIAVEETLAVAV
jgi:hypothetical protein